MLRHGGFFVPGFWRSRAVIVPSGRMQARPAAALLGDSDERADAGVISYSLHLFYGIPVISYILHSFYGIPVISYKCSMKNLRANR
jgi:hypothetical protein